MNLPGDVLANKYRLDRLLGEGGMGAVFAAENLNTGRRVAVKVLHTSLMTNPEAGARFVREARATTSIAHPNIVEVLDLDSDPARQIVYIVQEFLEGQTLEAALDARPGHRLSPEEAFFVLVPVMEALVAAHARGIVHRDIKPGNLFLARKPNGETVPKIIDFGIAKDVAQASSMNQTREGTMIGTPAYMSPEQVAGRADVDVQTDVWAMGVVLYETLSGRLPYEAENSNLLMGKILYEAPTPLASYAPDVPPDLAAVVTTALQRERRLRFRTMSDMLAALRAHTSFTPQRTLDDHVTLSLARPGVSPAAGATTADSTAFVGINADTMQAMARTVTRPGAPSPTRRRLIATAAVVTFALLSTAAWLSTRPSTETTARAAASATAAIPAPAARVVPPAVLAPGVAAPAAPVQTIVVPRVAEPAVPTALAATQPLVSAIRTPATGSVTPARSPQPARRSRRVVGTSSATSPASHNTVLGAEEM
jgi:serine/threonine protein kinase